MLAFMMIRPMHVHAFVINTALKQRLSTSTSASMSTFTISKFTSTRWMCSSSTSSLASSSNSLSLQLIIPTPDDMEDLGALLSQIATRPGDVLLLDGDLGAGKTCFSRGFVQTLVNCRGSSDNRYHQQQKQQQRVTSPTYLLCNSYDIASERTGMDGDGENGNYASQSPKTVHHMDLYRLAGKPEDLLPLNLDHIFTNDVSLIEWPQRLGATMLPSQRLELTLEIISSAGKPTTTTTTEEQEAEEDCMPRKVTLTPVGKHWKDRLSMIKEEGYVDDWIVLLEEEDEKVL